MGVVDSITILLLVFLLVILLGLQMQISAAGRDLAKMGEQLKKIMEQLNRSQSG